MQRKILQQIFFHYLLSFMLLPNLYEFLCSVEHKRKCFEKNVSTAFIHTMKLNGVQKQHHLCSGLE